MIVFITGVCGQLGHDVFNECVNRGYHTVGSDIKETNSFENYVQLDITDKDSVEKVLTQINPDVVVHCAGWTNVDLAESNEEAVYKINGWATEYIARACKKINCKMLYISTDYVFDGQGDEPWDPDCKDYSPLNVYGKSKLMGELAVSDLLEKYFIIRISWVFGKHGNNFVKTILKLSQTRDCIKVVSDQIGTPTYTVDLARLLIDIANTEKYGFYHATNSGEYISWYDFACEIIRQSSKKMRIIPVTTEEYGMNIAKRPHNSRLKKDKLIKNGFLPLPDWKKALNRYLTELFEFETCSEK